MWPSTAPRSLLNSELHMQWCSPKTLPADGGAPHSSQHSLFLRSSMSVCVGILQEHNAVLWEGRKRPYLALYAFCNGPLFSCMDILSSFIFCYCYISLELPILLPQLSKCWNYRWTPICPVRIQLVFSTWLVYLHVWVHTHLQCVHRVQKVSGVLHYSPLYYSEIVFSLNPRFTFS